MVLQQGRGAGSVWGTFLHLFTAALGALGWQRNSEMLEVRDLAVLRKLASHGAQPNLAGRVRSRSDASVRSARGAHARVI